MKAMIDKLAPASDLIARLRNGEPCIEFNDCCEVMDARSGCTCAEAADELARLTAENERLLVEGAALASWQCEYTDGKTGLVQDEGGSTHCAMAKRAARLTTEVERLRAALRDAYEVHAGSDGFIPETCAEGYQQQIIKQMVDCINAALKEPRT